MIETRDIHISVVSHGQGILVNMLLSDLACLPSSRRFQITLTYNIPENEIKTDHLPFPVRVVRNSHPKGFGANHNAAFRHPPLPDQRETYLIINPDIRLEEDAILPLHEILLKEPEIGLMAPSVKDAAGKPEDSAREFPTFFSLAAKALGKQSMWEIHDRNLSVEPHWVAGMFMLFRDETFEKLGGFNEKYFLYYEDVDLCCRVWLNGLKIQVQPAYSVIHNARRESRKNWKYFRWHLSSVMRYLLSPEGFQAKKLMRARMAGSR